MLKTIVGILLGGFLGMWLAGSIAVRQPDGWALLGPAWITGAGLGALIGAGIGAAL